MTFSESVTGFDSTTADVTVGGTSSAWTKGASAGTGAGPYTFTVSRGAPNTNGTLTIQIATSAAQDAAGNNSTGTSTISRTIDTIAPSSSVTFPVNGSSYNGTTYTGTISGTASDNLTRSRASPSASSATATTSTGTASSFSSVQRGLQRRQRHDLVDLCPGRRRT